MELHQLRYMVKLAKHLHFSKAALELGITQPTLSQQIERLETELGCKLFARRTRSVELTLAGEAFLLHAVRVLDELAALSDTLQTLPLRKNVLSALGPSPIFPALSSPGTSWRLNPAIPMLPCISLKKSAPASWPTCLKPAALTPPF